MSIVVALAADESAVAALQAGFADEVADGTAAIGGRIAIFDSPTDLVERLSLDPGVIALATADGIAALGGDLAGLIADPAGAPGVARSLFGPAAEQLDDETATTFGGWLVQFAPGFSEIMDGRPPEPIDPWANVDSCLDEVVAEPVPAPDSPLRSARFAGDPVLEACVLGTHRMMAPERGRAVLKVQSALIDLGFSVGAAGADGIFGDGTGGAVVAFKVREGLVPSDPVVGVGTMGRLDALFAG